MPAGRPSKYRPEFVSQAEKLCALGATDIEIADFFEVDLHELACWAMRSQEFYNAITPTPETLAKWAEYRAHRHDKRNAARNLAHANSPSLRLVNAMRARIWAAIGGRTDGALFSRLGYTREELMAHLESRFDAGMTWQNYGKWHVDHKRPCASFDQTDAEQFSQCWALDNLQPLWALDNIRKSAKYAGA